VIPLNCKAWFFKYSKTMTLCGKELSVFLISYGRKIKYRIKYWNKSPGDKPMLCLVGSGEYLPAMDPVDLFLFDQLKAEPRVICLPTAAGTEGRSRVEYWMNLGMSHYEKLGVQVESLPVVDSQSANSLEFAERVERANFVFLSGGRPDYLHNVLASSLVWQAAMKVHNGGGILAGCSAGAMIMGKGFPGFPRWQKGFGLLEDAVIIPHFDELPPLISRSIQRFVRRGNMVFGIDGSTALIVDGTRRFVRGQGGVTVLTSDCSRRYVEGQEVAALQ
jgi:cyanophycinase-like exopeptidase